MAGLRVSVDDVCVADAKPDCGGLGYSTCQCDETSCSEQCECVGAVSGDGCANCLCENGGVCNSISHECDCPDEWVGDHCEFLCTRNAACNKGKTLPLPCCFRCFRV